VRGFVGRGGGCRFYCEEEGGGRRGGVVSF